MTAAFSRLDGSHEDPSQGTPPEPPLRTTDGMDEARGDGSEKATSLGTSLGAFDGTDDDDEDTTCWSRVRVDGSEEETPMRTSFDTTDGVDDDGGDSLSWFDGSEEDTSLFQTSVELLSSPPFDAKTTH